MKSGKSFFEKNEMKKYRYKTGIIRMIWLIGLSFFALWIISGYVLDGSSTTRIYWFLVLGVIYVPIAIRFIYIFLTTHLKPRYIVVDEEKISIPEIPRIFGFSYGHKFSYERITHLGIVEKWTGITNPRSIWIYIESGKHRKAKIFKSMLESEAVFLEIYNAVKEKVNPDSCHLPPPHFRLL